MKKKNMLLYLFVVILLMLGLLAEILEWGKPKITMAEAIGLNDQTSSVYAQHELPWPEPRIQWLGHASILLEWPNFRVLLDPYFKDYCSISPRRWACPVEPRDLGVIDLVLISHAHRDHFDPDSLGQLTRIKKICIPNGYLKNLENLRNIDSIVEVSPLDEIVDGPIHLTALKMDHGGSRHHPWRIDAYSALGYMIQYKTHSIFWAGDTGVDVDIRALKAAYHPDGAILPIGAYLPEWPIGSVHLNPSQALDWAEVLGVQWVMPTHFGTFRLSWDKTEDALPRFLQEAAQRHITVALAPVISHLYSTVPEIQ
jgi:L-ascorbate metabolism protein UlaG (beta-lactamase superfamily)